MEAQAIEVGSEWVGKSGEIVRVERVLEQCGEFRRRVEFRRIDDEGAVGGASEDLFRAVFVPVTKERPGEAQAASATVKKEPNCIKCGVPTGSASWFCPPCRSALVAPPPASTPVSPAPSPCSVAALITEECESLREMLLEKNRAYGNSALDPLRIFSTANPTEQIRVRIDDKLSRLARGSAAGEDAILDLLGYLVLLRVAMRVETGQSGIDAEKEVAA